MRTKQVVGTTRTTLCFCSGSTLDSHHIRCLRPARAEKNVDIIPRGGRTLCVSLAVGTTLRANRVPQRSGRRRERGNGSRKLGRSCHKLQTILQDAVNLDEVVSGYACLSRLGQRGYGVSFYRIPTVERQRPWITHRISQRQWIMRRIGQREWIMDIQHPLVGVDRNHDSDPQRRTAQ